MSDVKLNPDTEAGGDLKETREKILKNSSEDDKLEKQTDRDNAQNKENCQKEMLVPLQNDQNVKLSGENLETHQPRTPKPIPNPRTKLSLSDDVSALPREELDGAQSDVYSALNDIISEIKSLRADVNAVKNTNAASRKSADTDTQTSSPAGTRSKGNTTIPVS